MAKNKKNGEFDRIRKIIETQDSKIHFVGIGGVSMYSLARISLMSSNSISGSDKEESGRTETLRSLGANISIGHSERNISDQQLVVYTHAVAENNPELIAAKQKNILLVSRAEYLGALMTKYNTRIGISGTHGKSTVVAMIDLILAFASCDHTTLSGAPLVPGELYRLGSKRDLILYEACEYKDSFLKFQPGIAVALNLEYDHPDYFPDIDSIKKSFTKALSKAKTVIINGDDENLCDIEREIKGPGRIIKIGISEKSDYSYKITSYKACGYKFSVYNKRDKIGDFELNIPGTYNVTNAVFAIVVAQILGIDREAIFNAIASYKGISGRFEKIGAFDNKEIFADYAHHPTAIRAAINALKMYTKDSITVVFKPHTYSRTRALFDEFANALSLADNVILTDIYAAREEAIEGVSSEKLAALIGSKATFCSDERVAEMLTGINHGVVVLMGAGSFDVIKKELL